MWANTDLLCVYVCAYIFFQESTKVSELNPNAKAWANHMFSLDPSGTADPTTATLQPWKEGCDNSLNSGPEGESDTPQCTTPVAARNHSSHHHAHTCRSLHLSKTFSQPMTEQGDPNPAVSIRLNSAHCWILGQWLLISPLTFLAGFPLQPAKIEPKTVAQLRAASR